jgi:hypothetical protein
MIHGKFHRYMIRVELEGAEFVVKGIDRKEQEPFSIRYRTRLAELVT